MVLVARPVRSASRGLRWGPRSRSDRLVVLDRGRIAEQGTHEALLRLDGHYAALWRRQSGGFLDAAYMQAAE